MVHAPEVTSIARIASVQEKGENQVYDTASAFKFYRHGMAQNITDASCRVIRFGRAVFDPRLRCALVPTKHTRLPKCHPERQQAAPANSKHDKQIVLHLIDPSLG